jgi:hypothetical protein
VLSHEIAYEIKSYLFIFEYFGWGIHLLSPVIRDPLLLRQGYVRKDLMFGQISFSYCYYHCPLNFIWIIIGDPNSFE